MEEIRIENLTKKERGASLVEYALLIAIMVVIAAAAVKVLGGTISQKMSQTGSTVQISS